MKNAVLVRSSAFKTQRVSRLARYLLNEGYKVTIICWNRHNQSKAEEVTRQNLKQEGAEIICFELFQEYGMGLAGLSARIKWARFIAKYINNHSADFVCFVDLDSMVASAWIKRIENKPVFIADFADFIEEYPIKFGSIVRPLIEAVNRLVFSKFDYVFVPTEQRLKPYMRNQSKVKIINNAPDVKLSIERGRNGSILYCGTLGPDRGISLICEALAKNNKLNFRVAGWGPFEEELLQYKGEKLTFLGHIDYDQVLIETAECDFVYCVYDPSISVNKFSDPNKFYEAIYFGKPLIVARGTGIDSIVEEEGIGIVIDYSSKSLIECIEKVSESDYESFIENINRCKSRFSSAANFKKLNEIFTKGL